MNELKVHELGTYVTAAASKLYGVLPATDIVGN